MLLSKNALFFAALSATGAFAELKELLNWPDGLTGPFDPDFSNRTFAPLQDIERWPYGKIPKGCKDLFQLRDHSPTDAEVYSVKYADCDRTWTFCRHKRAQLNIGEMAHTFGRMPVHMRSLVRHPIAVPQDGCSAEAWTGVGDIILYGPCRTVSVWVHETSHQLDARLDPDNNFSSSEAWTEALGNDTCVPDSYANNNVVEDFAQVTVAAQFNILTGFLPKQAHPGCLDHRENLLEDTFRESHLEYGGFCTNRPADSPVVSMNSTIRETRMSKRLANMAKLGVVGPCSFQH